MRNKILQLIVMLFPAIIFAGSTGTGHAPHLDGSMENLSQFRCGVMISSPETAPGCGMGPVIAQDVENKILNLSFIENVLVEVVWEPLWNQNMMTEEAKLKLGML